MLPFPYLFISCWAHKLIPNTMTVVDTVILNMFLQEYLFYTGFDCFRCVPGVVKLGHMVGLFLASW